MSEPLALTLGQKFELERMNRAIDATVDPQDLRALAKQLLQAWQSQKAATQWVMRQQLGSPSQVLRDLALDGNGLDQLGIGDAGEEDPGAAAPGGEPSESPEAEN